MTARSRLRRTTKCWSTLEKEQHLNSAARVCIQNTKTCFISRCCQQTHKRMNNCGHSVRCQHRHCSDSLVGVRLSAGQVTKLPSHRHSCLQWRGITCSVRILTFKSHRLSSRLVSLRVTSHKAYSCSIHTVTLLLPTPITLFTYLPVCTKLSSSYGNCQHTGKCTLFCS